MSRPTSMPPSYASPEPGPDRYGIYTSPGYVGQHDPSILSSLPGDEKLSRAALNAPEGAFDSYRKGTRTTPRRVPRTAAGTRAEHRSQASTCSTPFTNAADASSLAARLKNALAACKDYVSYRAKYSEDPSHTLSIDKSKWPDRIEDAFIEAIARCPPPNRLPPKPKYSEPGRPQLISDYIFRLTGVKMKKKQISSHIQTIQGKVSHDPFLRRHFPRLRETETSTRWSRRRERYEARSVMTARRRTDRSSGPEATSSDPYEAYSELAQELHRLEPSHLEMLRQRGTYTHEGHIQAESVHTYTELVTGTQQYSDVFSDWSSLEQSSPAFSWLSSGVIASDHHSFGCDFIMAKANIKLPDIIRSDGNDSLFIDLKFGLRPGAAMAPMTIKYRNSFFHAGQRIIDGPEMHHATLMQSCGDLYEVPISFGIDFWARILAGLSNRCDAARILHSITVVQEMYYPSNLGDERILVVLWTFDLASSHTPGTASWQVVRFTNPTSPKSSIAEAVQQPYFVPENDQRSLMADISHTTPYLTDQDSAFRHLISSSDAGSSSWHTTTYSTPAVSAFVSPPLTNCTTEMHYTAHDYKIDPTWGYSSSLEVGALNPTAVECYSVTHASFPVVDKGIDFPAIFPEHEQGWYWNDTPPVVEVSGDAGSSPYVHGTGNTSFIGTPENAYTHSFYDTPATDHSALNAPSFEDFKTGDRLHSDF